MPRTPRSILNVRIGFNYTVSRDGQRFLVDTTLDQQVRDPVSIRFNWAVR